MRIKTVHVARTRIDFVRSERFQPQSYAVPTGQPQDQVGLRLHAAYGLRR